MLDCLTMSHAGNASVRDHYGDLVKTDDSMSSPGSVMTTSPGEIESALPEEQKLVKRKGGRKPVGFNNRFVNKGNVPPADVTLQRYTPRQRNESSVTERRKLLFESVAMNTLRNYKKNWTSKRSSLHLANRTIGLQQMNASSSDINVPYLKRYWQKEVNNASSFLFNFSLNSLHIRNGPRHRDENNSG